MRASHPLLLPLTLALALALTTPACQGSPVSRAVKAAVPGPTAEATAQRTAAPTPAAAAPSSLVAPAVPFHAVEGMITADAAYLVSDGGAKLISNNGGSVLALGSGALVSNNGSNVVASTAGGLVATDASGTFLAAGNVGLLSDNGGGVISNDGGSIVSNNGSNVISNDGGSISASRRVLLAAPAATRLPAAGLVVSAVSLSSHAYVPLGRTPDGKPVYTIYSDAHGHYKLYLPASELGNVVVAANVPRSQDRHLAYNALAPATRTEPVSVDDDSSGSTRLARQILASQLARTLTSQSSAEAFDLVSSKDSPTPAAFSAGLLRLIVQLSQVAHAHHVPTTPGAEDLPDVQALAALLADQALAALPLEDLAIDPLLVPGWTGSNENAYAALTGGLGSLREAAERYLAARRQAGSPGPVRLTVDRYRKTHTVGAEADCHYPVSFTLGAPADAQAYVVDDLLSRTLNDTIYNTELAFAALRLAPGASPTDASAPGPGEPGYYLDPGNQTPQMAAHRIQAAIDTVIARFVLALSPPGEAADAPPNPLLAGLLATIASYADAHHFAGPANPRPLVARGTPCVPVPIASP